MSEEEKREERIRKLTTTELFPLIVKMAIPSMIGMMVVTVYNMTDTFWVGKLDNEAYTASVGVVFAFVSVIQAIGFWFGYGSGNYMSRMLGKKDYTEAERMAAIGVSVAGIAGILIMICGFIFINPLIEILGGTTSQELAEATDSYLKITICTVPFMLFSNVIYNQLRLSGAAKSSMIGLLAGMLINMVLDPVFILIFDMGVAGAAYASLAGQVAGCVMLYRQTGRNGNVAIIAKNLKPDLHHVKEILAGGAPNFCRQGITSISSVVLNNIAGIYGVSVIAAVTVSQRVVYIAYALVIGFGQGFQPVCAINYGAGKRERVRKAFKLTWLTVTIFLIVATPLLLIFADKLTGAFATQQDVVELASKMLKAQCVVLPFMGYYILSGMMLQNIGRFGLATSVTIAENGTVFIPVIFICTYFWQMEGIVLAKPIASALSFVYSIVIGTYAWRKYLCEEKRAEVEVLKTV
ncbi:MAG: MATE family efflux transporter [Lachnospiraceae bacterium]|nr:MATE family efflux transporter [Lachnospiraceae bacterium]